MLESLRTSIFIDNWLARCNAFNLERSIKIFREAAVIMYNPVFANIVYERDMQKYFRDGTGLKINAIIKEITIKINSNTHILIDIENPGLCGCDNCFKIYEDLTTNEKYGIRFSNELYAPGTTELYNKINGMLNNAVIYSMMELFNRELPSQVASREFDISSKIAKIQEMTQVGLIKVILSKDGTKYGYIPYIITKNSNTQIDIQKYIEKKIASDVEWTEDNVKTFIFDLIVKLFNFLVIAYAKLNFMHRDFKLNNIVIDTVDNTIYIIDFDWSSLNINYSSGRESNIYFLTPRNFEYDIRQSTQSGEYKWYIEMISNKQKFLDTDIQGFLAFFLFVEEEHKPGELYEKYRTMAATKPNVKRYHNFIRSFLGELINFGNTFTKPTPDRPDSILYKTLVDKKINLSTNTLIFRLFDIMNTLVSPEYSVPAEEFIDVLGYKLIDYDITEYIKDKKLFDERMSGASQAGGKRKTKTNALKTRTTRKTKKQLYTKTKTKTKKN